MFNTEYLHAILLVLPEFALLCLATGLLILDCFLPRTVGEFKNYRLTFWLVNLSAFIVLLLVYFQQDLIAYNLTSYANVSLEIADSLTKHMLATDALSFILKVFMIIAVLISFYYSDHFLRTKQIFSGEYYAMGLFSLLGMMVLVSAVNMVTLYLGLELFSLPIYAMVASQRKSAEAGEAALKYFVMGAIASGILLFGMSIIYGISGSVSLTDISHYNNINSAFVLGLVFVCVGIAFKFGAAPFHMWTPDVYQGAPTPVALFISAAPKLAAFGMAIRFLHEGFNFTQQSWGYIFYLLAVLSVAWGSFGALAQTNFKRLLAYSAISHMGFILLGLAIASTDGTAYSATLFYVIVYTLMSLAVFGFILMYGDGKYELVNLEDYRGLYYKQPWLAFMLLMVLLSMAGVPPFIGFFSKMAIIQKVVANGYYYTAVGIVLLSVVGAYYYLKLLWLMFFERPQTSQQIVLSYASNTIALDLKILVSVNCLLIIALGLYSQWLFAWCASVF